MSSVDIKVIFYFSFSSIREVRYLISRMLAGGSIVYAIAVYYAAQ